MDPADAQVLERLVSEQDMPVDWVGLHRWQREVGGIEEAKLPVTVWSGMKGVWQRQPALQQSGVPPTEWNQEVAAQPGSALPSSPCVQVGPRDQFPPMQCKEN